MYVSPCYCDDVLCLNASAGCPMISPECLAVHTLPLGRFVAARPAATHAAPLTQLPEELGLPYGSNLTPIRLHRAAEELVRGTSNFYIAQAALIAPSRHRRLLLHAIAAAVILKKTPPSPRPLVYYLRRYTLLQEELAHGIQLVLARRERQERTRARRVALKREEFSPRVDGRHLLLVVARGTHRLCCFMKGLDF